MFFRTYDPPPFPAILEVLKKGGIRPPRLKLNTASLSFDNPNMIEELVHDLTPGQAVLYFIGAFFFACLARKIQVQWQLSRLGSRAPKIQFRLPYGVLNLSISLS